MQIKWILRFQRVFKGFAITFLAIVLRRFQATDGTVGYLFQWLLGQRKIGRK